MSERKARLLITEACNRNCGGCCNRHEKIMDQMVEIDSLTKLAGYDVVCLTGGEVMLDGPRLLACIQVLRECEVRTIYVYTALYSKQYFQRAVTVSDGIHYSIHRYPTEQDIEDLVKAEAAFAEVGGAKSHRLYIDSRVSARLTIRPHLWSRIDSSPWLTEEQVIERNGPTGLPPGEELFLFDRYKCD